MGELEIKHGRIAMLACVGVITTEAGIRFPGYLSKSLDLKFADVPGGAFDSYSAVPVLGWFQIVAFVSFLELAYGAVDPTKEPGDVGGVSWIRYDDPEVKKFKLNAERNNGRAAMMGITGMLIHEGLTGNPVWPIPVPPQPVLEIVTDDIEKGPARVGSFVLASLGMAAAGILAAIPEFGKEE